MPWARAASARLEGLDWDIVAAVTHSSTGFVPDFPSPPPTTPLAAIALSVPVRGATTLAIVIAVIEVVYLRRSRPLAAE